jgi:hypothetical protein
MIGVGQEADVVGLSLPMTRRGRNKFEDVTSS